MVDSNHFSEDCQNSLVKMMRNSSGIVTSINVVVSDVKPVNAGLYVIHGDYVLIQAKPAMSSNRGIQYSGIGGAIEENEHSYNAALRECEEEAGFRPVGKCELVDMGSNFSKLAIYCVQYNGETIEGPKLEFAHEIEKFADFTQFSAATRVIVGTGHAWVPISAVLTYAAKKTGNVSGTTVVALKKIQNMIEKGHF
jgi:8-oxo-dGTP pyrophosphatase MutT (NUDIX family)